MSEPRPQTTVPGTEKAVTRRTYTSQAFVGLAVLALISSYFSTSASSSTLYVYNLCLLGIVGATALNLLMGTAGQVSIGNAAFLVVGAFGTVWAHRLGVPFPLDIVVAAALGAASGLLVGLPALRIQGLYLALATLAAHFIALYFAGQYQSKADGAGSGGFPMDPKFMSLGLQGQQQAWTWVLFGVAAIVILAHSQLLAGRCGRALRLIRTHETVAAAMGISVARTKLVLFSATSALTAGQGGLTAYLTGSVSVDAYSLLVAVSYIAMIIIGGLDSLWGGAIGAMLVISLPTISTNLVQGLGGSAASTVHAPQYAQIAYGALIIVFVLFSRDGIAGWPRAVSRSLRRRLIPVRRRTADEPGIR